MAEPRTRDRVWKYALGLTLRSDNAVKPAQIAEAADCSEKTARETLNIIADTGWIQRDVLPDGKVRFVAPDGLEAELEFLHN